MIQNAHTPESASSTSETPTLRKRTLSNDHDAEARVAQDIARLSAAIDGELGPSLIALVLLGTYARGEGSVSMQRGELHAASPYELLAIVHGRALDGGRRLPRLSAAWSSRLAVDVRLRGLTLRELRDVRPSLTWLDVVAGRAEVLAGPQRVLAPLRPPHPKDLPLEASAALLTDAATALAYAQLDGVTWERHGPRHMHHAVLTCGDAFLLQNAHYDFDIMRRQAELARVQSSHGLDGLAEAYANAIRYQTRPDLEAAKLHPNDAACAEIRALVGHVHLTLEQRRLGTPVDAMSYALYRGRLWSQTRFLPFAALSAALRAAREGNASRIAYLGDARERLARAATLLAYARERPEAVRLAARLLGIADPGDAAPDTATLLVRLRRLAARVQRAPTLDPLGGARYGAL